MSLIPREELTILKPAVEARTIANQAPQIIERNSIASAINNAVNTGQFSVSYGKIEFMENVNALKSAGYELTGYGQNGFHISYKISWEEKEQKQKTKDAK